jgi:stage V sporulation protein SpoVS
MKTKTLIFAILLSGCQISENQTVAVQALPVESVQDKIKALADANGFEASNEVVDAIARASQAFEVDAMQLTAIGIIESGLGKYAKTRKNNNGTHDHGVFQINTVNLPKCKAFRVDTVEGSAFCAAKLLSQIKIKKPSDVAKYHSKTPSKKMIYFSKITQVLSAENR